MKISLTVSAVLFLSFIYQSKSPVKYSSKNAHNVRHKHIFHSIGEVKALNHQ
jgi:hypothetical protein